MSANKQLIIKTAIIARKIYGVSEVRVKFHGITDVHILFSFDHETYTFEPEEFKGLTLKEAVLLCTERIVTGE